MVLLTATSNSSIESGRLWTHTTPDHPWPAEEQLDTRNTGGATDQDNIVHISALSIFESQRTFSMGSSVLQNKVLAQLFKTGTG